MIRREISLFLKNVPGELGKLTALFGDAGINIDAITIQDASAYVQNLFEARGKSLKRLASSASYSSMRRDSAQFALTRLIVDRAEKAIDLLKENDYLFDSKEVVAIDITNKPGECTKITRHGQCHRRDCCLWSRPWYVNNKEQTSYPRKKLSVAKYYF